MLYTGIDEESVLDHRLSCCTNFLLMNISFTPVSNRAFIECVISFDSIVRGIFIDCPFILATSTELIESLGGCIVASHLCLKNPVEF